MHLRATNRRTHDRHLGQLELVVLDDPLNSCSGNEIAFQWDGTVEFMQCSLWQGGTFFVFSLWKEQSDSTRGAQSVVLME